MTNRASLPALWLIALLASAPTPLAAQTTVDTTEAAQEAATPREVEVEADQMQVLDAEKKAIFKGNVSARRGGVHLTCDVLTVTYVETDDGQGGKKTEVTFLDAQGNVKIVTARQTVTGEAARMDVKANDVTVTGNVKVVQGRTVLSGAKLAVDLDTNRSELSGGRVRGSFVPGQ
jgi:lipopolysaccharide export system protein LptA